MQGEERNSRGVWIGLAISALLHLGLLGWALSRPDAPRPKAPDEPAALEVTVVEIEAQTPDTTGPSEAEEPAAEPKPEPPPPSPRGEPARPTPRRAETPPPKEAAPKPVEAAPPAEAPPQVAEVAPPEPRPMPVEPDAPTAPPSPGSEHLSEGPRAPAGPGRGAPLRGPSAAPGERPWFVPDGAIPTGPGKASAGSTTRPGDDGGAAARERLAEGPRVKERVDGILAEAGGAYRVATGTMDPYFGELGRALNAELENVPEALGRPSVLREMYADYIQKMQRSGRTGAAWEDTPLGEGRDRDTVPMVNLQRDAERYGASFGGGGPPVLLNASGQRGKLPSILSAEVSIHQAPDGSILEVKLLRGSGNPVFDRFVLEVGPASVKRLAPPPERGSGIRASGLKSAWSFTGNLKLDKRLRDFKLPDDLPYLSALVLSGQFGGGFDLTNLKDTPVADLRDPRWDLKAKLLRVE